MSLPYNQLYFSRLVVILATGFGIGWVWRDYKKELAVSKDPARLERFKLFRQARKEYLRPKVLSGLTVEEILDEVEAEDKQRGWR